MKQNYYSLKEIAAEVGVKAYRISYAISTGFLKEPAERITNRRMFSEADLQAAKKYFAVTPKYGRPRKEVHG
ncbi:MAG TPA: MerR family transcriptional regulator [Pirellulales bacterium]|jgi:DNA-binding transcriptional MerR regulator|nr:MerR family transcriptional regulator [Pirellulales bacterium]